MRAINAGIRTMLCIIYCPKYSFGPGSQHQSTYYSSVKLFMQTSLRQVAQNTVLRCQHNLSKQWNPISN